MYGVSYQFIGQLSWATVIFHSSCSETILVISFHTKMFQDFKVFLTIKIKK